MNAHNLIARMMAEDHELFERILDSPMASAFNKLTKLAIAAGEEAVQGRQLRADELRVTIIASRARWEAWHDALLYLAQLEASLGHERRHTPIRLMDWMRHALWARNEELEHWFDYQD